MPLVTEFKVLAPFSNPHPFTMGSCVGKSKQVNTQSNSATATTMQSAPKQQTETKVTKPDPSPPADPPKDKGEGSFYLLLESSA